VTTSGAIVGGGFAGRTDRDHDGAEDHRRDHRFDQVDEHGVKHTDGTADPGER
jgi:hypothetical protein